MLASHYGHADVVDMLLKHKAQVDLQDDVSGVGLRSDLQLCFVIGSFARNRLLC